MTSCYVTPGNSLAVHRDGERLISAVPPTFNMRGVVGTSRLLFRYRGKGVYFSFLLRDFGSFRRLDRERRGMQTYARVNLI